MSPRGLIEGILLAALGVAILVCRRRIVDYIIRRNDMKRRDALAKQALDLKRKYRAARADEDWPSAQRLQREYRQITGEIARLDRTMKAKEKAPGDVAASTESRSNKTTQVYHDSGEDASHD